MSNLKSTTETCYEFLIRTILEHAEGSNPDACLLWPFNKSKEGYGKLKHDGKHYRAHRVAYRLANGGEAMLKVLHRCDNPLVTIPSIFLRELRKIIVWTVMPRAEDAKGKRRNNVILTEEQVREIRATYKSHAPMTPNLPKSLASVVVPFTPW